MGQISRLDVFFLCHMFEVLAIPTEPTLYLKIQYSYATYLNSDSGKSAARISASAALQILKAFPSTKNL